MTKAFLPLALSVFAVAARASDLRDTVRFTDGRTEFHDVELKPSFPAVYKLVLDGNRDVKTTDVDVFTAGGSRYGVFHTGPFASEQVAAYKRSCGLDYYEVSGISFTQMSLTTGLPVTRGSSFAEYYAYKDFRLKEFTIGNLETDFGSLPEPAAQLSRMHTCQWTKWGAFVGGAGILLIGGATHSIPVQQAGLAVACGALVPWGLQTWFKHRVRPAVEKHFRDHGCKPE